jgi:hypothetical protein
MFDGADRARAVPSPRHVILDHKNRRVMFTGPRNEEEMFKYLAGKDLQEEDTEEENHESDNKENTNDEYPEEKRCGPHPDRRDTPYEGDDERLRTPTS